MAVSRHESEAISQPGADAPWSPAGTRRPFGALPGEGKMSLRGANECFPARKPPRRKRRWRAFTPETPSKKPYGAMNTPVHDSNRPNEPPMRDGIPRPRLLSRAGASQLFPHRLKRNAALRRRDPVPFPAPPRPLTRAFARASPFAAYKSLATSQPGGEFGVPTLERPPAVSFAAPKWFSG